MPPPVVGPAGADALTSAPASARGSPAASSMHQTGPSKMKANGHTIPPPNPLSSMTSAPLDLSSVERRGQPTACKDPIRKTSRPHGLQEAPTFYPTDEEFAEPFKYIEKIRAEAREYGICRIVPPEGWNPDFAIDTTRFHFLTRKQELNSIDGGVRANSTYTQGLRKFHQQHGIPPNRTPYVDKKPLNLFLLKKAVEARGGFEKVCKLKKWAEIGRDLGYSGKIMSSLSTSLKNSYQRWVNPYEAYLLKAKPAVHQQLELEYGGPLTPSPAQSPMKRSEVNTPACASAASAASPAKNATDALQASMNGHTTDRDTPMSDVSPSQAKAGSFTALNSGGFTAVKSPFRSHNTPDYQPSKLGPASALKRQLSCDSLDSTSKDATDKDDGENSSRRSKRVKTDNVPTVAGSHMSLLRPTVPRIPRDENAIPGEKCEQCGNGEEGGLLLICDSCDHGYHGACVEPPIKTKPDTEWNCPRCLVGDGNFGFEEGGLYSLKQFQEKANDFKEGYFENKMPFDPVLNCSRPVTEDDVEREFWRLVADLEETVEVEYGADIHCTTHGSGFPTAEKNPDNAYSTDPWNLNILPLHSDSLFRYIKSDISGMTVPWLYVGMIFSTFCWHAEDHWSYSANYQHFGATKTWYGIPGEDAEKFEAAMREAVPELFETQPDLLFQLVTLLTPEQLKKAGVRVYALDQRAGQFVITFPRAYHAGFNHGFNCNEAVNFAPSDWEPHGSLGVETLQQFRRQPCFSHDELLWTAAEGIASNSLTIPTAKWLSPALEKVHQREISQRDSFAAKHCPDKGHKCRLMGAADGDCRLTHTIEDVDVPEEEYACVYCKAYSYLSRFKCEKTGKVLCLLHAGIHPCCDASESDRFLGKDHVLCYRKTGEAMAATLKKVADKAHLPEAWEEKYQKVLDEEACPSLKTLRSLLAEGEKIPFELPSLPNLREFVERCNHWVEEAIHYTMRKQQERERKKVGGKPCGGHTGWEPQKGSRDKELRKIENIHRLLAEAELIGFSCPEITQLQYRAEDVERFQAKAKLVLERGRTLQKLEEVEELLEEGQALHLTMPEVAKLNETLKRLQWEQRAAAKRGAVMDLDDVREFIDEGVELGVHEWNEHLQHLREQFNSGRTWEVKARELMHADVVHYPQLQALADQAEACNLPTYRETREIVDRILHKQREAHRQILELNQRSQDADYRKRPKYAEVADIMKKIEELQAKPPGTLDLEREQRRHEDWMRKGKKLFGKTNAPLHILKTHMDYVLDRNQDCFNIHDDKPRVPAEPASREPSPDPANKSSQWEDPRFREVFCICRRIEAGMMIECELCHEWYHGKCLKIARGKVKEDDKYTCPICDWRVKIPRDAARPKLEDLMAWHDEVPGLPFQPEEEDVLKKIIDNAQEFRNHIAPCCNPILSTRSDAETQRFYLRKIEGAEILLVFETNFFRRELHKWSPVAPEAPPVLDESKSTRKPRPTKLQKILSQYGVSDPDDLPEDVRGKANSLKRKALHAEATANAAAAASNSMGSSSTTSPGLNSFGGHVHNFYSRNSSAQPQTPSLSIASSSHAHASHGPGSSASSTAGGHRQSDSGSMHPTFFMPEGAGGGNGPQLLSGGNATLSLEERLLSAHSEAEDDMAVSKDKTLEILSRTEHGRRRAEDVYGKDVWQKAVPSSRDDNDPIGIGVGEGDVDKMFGELVNQDEDEDAGPKKAHVPGAVAEQAELFQDEAKAMLDGAREVV